MWYESRVVGDDKEDTSENNKKDLRVVVFECDTEVRICLSQIPPPIAITYTRLTFFLYDHRPPPGCSPANHQRRRGKK